MSDQRERQQARRDRLRRQGIVTLGPLYVPEPVRNALKWEAARAGEPLLTYAAKVLQEHVTKVTT